jgi:4-hydroxy-4-methyl-2-oxoglutarate aldolase
MNRIDPALTTRLDFERVSPELVKAGGVLPSATLHEAAAKIGVMPTAIKPVVRGMRITGPALTLHSPGGDNLWLHRAIYAAQPGDVLVVSVSGAYDHGYWGEIMATAAKVRGLAGLVIDGCVRDGDLLGDIGFPVFARGLSIRGTGKDFGARGWIGHPTLFDDLTVHAGDLVVGDSDGVVVIPRAQAAQAVEASLEREAGEAEQLRRIKAGESTLKIFSFE